MRFVSTFVAIYQIASLNDQPIHFTKYYSLCDIAFDNNCISVCVSVQQYRNTDASCPTCRDECSGHR